MINSNNETYETYDVVFNGENVATVHGYKSDLVKMFSSKVEFVLWENGIDPNLSKIKNKNTYDIPLMITYDRDENSFWEIAEFVDDVRKQNKGLTDEEIFITRDETQSDHEVVTLVVPKAT